MARGLILVISVFILSHTVSLASELVIELKTDKYASETSWKLFDTEKELIFEKLNFGNDSIHFDTIQLSDEKCYFWTLYDAYGDGFSNINTAGYFKIFLDGSLISESVDPNYGDSISVYGLGVSCLNSDAAIHTLLFEETQTFDSFDLAFSITNFGVDTIKSIEVKYTLNGEEKGTEQFNQVNLGLGESDTLSFADQLQILEPGSYQLVLTITLVNGEPESNTANNTQTKNIEIRNGFTKTPLLEVYTSSTCGPCNYGNYVIDGVLENYNTSQYSLVKYQVNFPGAGDPYYTSEVGDLMKIYNVNAAPSLYVNAQYNTPSSFSTDAIDPLLQELSITGLEIDGEVIGDSVFVSGKVMAAGNTTEDVFIRLSVVEKTTYNNVATNGETQFHNVFMKLLSEWDGDNLGQLNTDDEINISYKENIEATNIEEFADLRVVAYLFYKSDKSILQSIMIDLPFTPLAPVIVTDIENGATEIDTLPKINIYSNKPLVNLDGSEITNIKSKILFHELNNPENGASFNASLSDDYKTITIETTNYLDANASYQIQLMDVMSNEGVAYNDTVLTFSTIITVGLNMLQQMQVKVYPNPADNELIVKANCSGIIKLYNQLGVEIKNESIVKGLNVISINDLLKGVYYLKISDLSNTKAIKIIKK